MAQRSFIGLLAAVAVSLGACATDQYSREVQHAPAIASSWPDECSQLQGYTAFRRKLERAVTTRDTRALVGLLHPRLLPKHSSPVGSVPDYRWLFGRYKAEAAWLELQKVFKFGCVRHGEGVLLPAMAKLADDMSVEPGTEMAIVNLAVRAKPEPSALALQFLKPGDLVRTTAHGTPEGWVAVLINDQEGFVRETELRSPYGFQLVLRRESNRWYIHEFGSGV